MYLHRGGASDRTLAWDKACAGVHSCGTSNQACALSAGE